MYLCPRLESCISSSGGSLQASPVLCTPTCPLLGRGAPCSRLSLTSCWPDRVVLVDVDLRHALCHRRLTDEMDEADDLESVLTSADALVKRTQKRTGKMRKRERNICATHVRQLPRLGFLPPKYCKVGTEASLSSVDTEDTEVLGEPCPARALIPAARTRRCFPI